jgi:hypothetical protein
VDVQPPGLVGGVFIGLRIMKEIMGIEFPSGQAFQEAKKFIEQHPSLTLPEYIRLVLKKYNKKIRPRTYLDVMTRLFDDIVNNEGTVE